MQKIYAITLLATTLLYPMLQVSGASSKADDAWYTEPKVFNLRPSVDKDSEFGTIGVTGIVAKIKKGVVITVDSVEDGSPAEGVVNKGDIILGVNGEILKGKNPYVLLGNTLTKAEASDGILSFELKDKQGRKREAKVKIPVLGSYSKNYPHKCKKSYKIVKDAAKFYADQLSGKGRNQIKMDGIEKSLAGLFLLSTGDDKYLPVVRRLFDEELKDKNFPKDGSTTWHLGYRGILYAEYYLRTGDKSVLPALQKICNAAKLGMRYNVSWAHKIYDTPTVYWLMNAAGTNLLTTMLMGKMCGVDVDNETLLKALRFWYRFSGHGAVPYGDHRPGGFLGSNGKDGMAAAAMLIASKAKGDVSRFRKAYEWSVMTMADQYPSMVQGHGDDGRGDAIWRGIALSGLQEFAPEFYSKEMNRYKWWLDLSRQKSGGFRIATLHKFNGIGSGVAIPLFYTAQLRKLQITGAPKSRYAKSFSLPNFNWGTKADLTFLSTKHCPGYENYGPDEEMHILNNKLLQASRTNRKRPILFPEKLSLEYLLKNVRHREIEVRIAAAKALRHFGHFKELEKLLGDPDPRLRRAAIDGLLDWRGHFHMGKKRIKTEQYTPGMISALNKILNNPEEAWWVKDGALFAMNGAPASAVEENLPAILPWTKSEEGYLRMASFLGLLGAKKDNELLLKVLPTLTEMLGDPRKSNRVWMNPLLADVYEEHKNNPEMVRMIKNGFLKAIKNTTVLKDHGLCRRQAEGLSIIKGSAQSLMIKSEDSALPLAKTIANRLSEITPDQIITIVSAPSIDMGPKGRMGLYTMISKQKNPETQKDLKKLLYTKYRPRMIEMLNEDVPKNLKNNLILSIADLAKLGNKSEGWQSIGKPAPEAAEWRYYTFNTTSKKKIPWSRVMTRNDFTNAKVPAGMEEWYQPNFDDSEWAVGAGPFGKGRFEGTMKRGGRHYPIGVYFDNRTAWPEEHEFLMMRTELELDPDTLDYGLYRLSVLAAGCYKVFVNGKPVEIRPREEGFPRYVGKHATSLSQINFKKGKNTIAVISNHMLQKHSKKAYAQIDFRLEGLKASDLKK